MPESASGSCSSSASTRASPKRPDPPLHGDHAPVELYDAVPDTLGPGMRLVFVGINPGHWSARANAPFANPRNDFWRLLHAAGLTPRVLEPQEHAELLDLGIGLTNAARRTTRGSGELRKADFAGAAERLEELVATYHPSILAFVGKAAYTGTFGGRAELGLQERTIDGTGLFLLPSTSPANAAVPWDERLRWFRALGELVDA
jgi:TDG/mug DNA glycosylase family protein